MPFWVLLWEELEKRKTVFRLHRRERIACRAFQKSSLFGAFFIFGVFAGARVRGASFGRVGVEFGLHVGAQHVQKTYSTIRRPSHVVTGLRR